MPTSQNDGPHAAFSISVRLIIFAIGFCLFGASLPSRAFADSGTFTLAWRWDNDLPRTSFAETKTAATTAERWLKTWTWLNSNGEKKLGVVFAKSDCRLVRAQFPRAPETISVVMQVHQKPQLVFLWNHLKRAYPKRETMAVAQAVAAHVYAESGAAPGLSRSALEHMGQLKFLRDFKRSDEYPTLSARDKGELEADITRLVAGLAGNDCGSAMRALAN